MNKLTLIFAFTPYKLGILAALGGFLLALDIVYIQYTYRRFTADLHVCQQLTETYEREGTQLLLERSSLTALAPLEAFARDALAMHKATPEESVVWQVR